MVSTPITSSQQLIAVVTEYAKQHKPKRVAVAAAQDADVIEAVAQAVNEGFIGAILVGNGARIRQMAAEKQVNLERVEIIEEADVEKAAHKAVALVSEGKADILMKGFLPTSKLLKIVLDKKYNLRGKNTLSHCAVLEIPGYHKFLNFTDGGMVVRPDAEQKFQILENAVTVGRALGLSPVKIALSAAHDQPSIHVQHTLTDLDSLIPRALAELKDIAIQGPLPLDLATTRGLSPDCRPTGSVAGDADIYLVDSIEEGNIVAKSLIQFAKAVFAGVIVGARAPVSLVSRTDTAKNKKASLAIAALLAEYYQRTRMFA